MVVSVMAVDWSWSPLAISAAVLILGMLVLRWIRDHGPTDPIAYDPEGEE